LIKFSFNNVPHSAAFLDFMEKLQQLRKLHSQRSCVFSVLLHFNKLRNIKHRTTKLPRWHSLTIVLIIITPRRRTYLEFGIPLGIIVGREVVVE
jgi:hypothetical protein